MLGSGATVTNPGAGLCGSIVLPGTYDLSQVAPPGTVFGQWVCYNTSTGTVISTGETAQTLAAGEAATCVAQYLLASSPSPSPGVAPADR